MDINMPELDGYEATRQLRALAYARPILALTANAMADDCQRYLVAGCDAHIAKPIDRRQLIETIQRVVGTPARADAAPGPDPCEAAGRTPAADDLVSPVAAEPPPLATLAGLPTLAEGLADVAEAVPETGR
jgi:DNA-binding response OmpR family regulator